MPKMLTICPTRGRVKLFTEMIESFIENTTKDTHIMCSIDENDDQFNEYLDIMGATGVTALTSYPKTVTEHINDIFKAFPQYDFYHITNDDVLYKTPNWDFKVMDLMRNGGIGYCNDLFQGKNLPTFPIISRDIAEAVGWLQQPTLNRLCGDTIWGEIGNGAKCLHYFDGIVIEHRHWLNGKRENDFPDYKKVYDMDRMKFANWLANDSVSDTRKVRQAMRKGE